MAAVAMPHSHMQPSRDEHTMDTRTPSPGPKPKAEPDDRNAEYQPDLSQEVSLLSTKLINAINYQTNLDDSLQHTRHELEAANRENARLKAEKKSLDDMITSGILIRKSAVDKTMGQLRAELAKERAAREEAEKARKQTDAELENLTTALFEEANTMVAAARKDTEAVEKRNSQLKGQIVDTEMLLASQQEQLQDLKLTMGRMSERGDNDTAARDSIPSTPIGSTAAYFDAMQLSPNAANIADIPPEHPLFFSQLLTPILRSDIPAYLDFQDLLQSARKAISHSRAGSTGNSSSGGLSSSSQSNIASSSSPSLPGAFSFSTTSSPQSNNYVSTVPPLKDSKFYKRSLVEDIEPTLRLDLAPGLSFLSRRTVLSSLLQGSMVVEPFLPQTKFYGPIFSCALCGESRKNEPYVRKHRFRTSEEESAQRYPLCDYCLSRTRAAGDFVGFLRMVRDGHWRAESEEEQKIAWEEAVKLRERMFWARQGGGVVPSLTKQETASTANPKSARQSLESIAEHESAAKRASLAMQAAQAEVDQSNAGLALGRALQQEPDVAEKPQPDEKLLDVLKTHRQSMSSGSAPVAAEDVPPLPEISKSIPVPEPEPEIESRDAVVEDTVLAVEEPLEKPVVESVEEPVEKPTIVASEPDDTPVQPQVIEPEAIEPQIIEPHAVPEPEPEIEIEQELSSTRELPVAVDEQSREQLSTPAANATDVVTEAAEEEFSTPINEVPTAPFDFELEQNTQSTDATIVVTEVSDDEEETPAPAEVVPAVTAAADEHVPAPEEDAPVVTEVADEHISTPREDAPVVTEVASEHISAPTETAPAGDEVADEQISVQTHDAPMVSAETVPDIIASQVIDDAEEAAQEPTTTTTDLADQNNVVAESEAPAVTASKDSDEAEAAIQESTPVIVEPVAEEKTESDAPPAQVTATESATPAPKPEPKLTLGAPPRSTERRGSSVLDRVRAMNANAQSPSPTEEKKFPGSFN